MKSWNARDQTKKANCERNRQNRKEQNNGTQKRSRSRRPETFYPDCKAGKKHQRSTEGIARRNPIINHTNKERGDKMALIKVKDVKEAIALMMNILEKLDEIYHALKDANKDKE